MRAAVSPDGAVVERYLFDAALGRTWAVMRNCRHPEWPAWLAPLAGRPDLTSGGGAEALPKSVPPAGSQAWVRAGSQVRVWRDGEVRIQLAGVALASAPPGAEVTVRAVSSGTLLRGVVRGPGSVELLEVTRVWRQP